MLKKIAFIFLPGILLLLIVGFFYAYFAKHGDLEEKQKRYNEGLKVVKVRDNGFYPQAKLDYYDSLLAGYKVEGRELQLTLYYRCAALVEIGREKDAITTLEAILKNHVIGEDDPVFPHVQKLLALAYLRLGERTNCVGNHMAESCIYPIRGDGVYTDPYATQKAIAIYEDVLRRNSKDLEARWLLNIAYMTLGTYPAGVPESMLIPGLNKDSSGIAVNP